MAIQRRKGDPGPQPVAVDGCDIGREVRARRRRFRILFDTEVVVALNTHGGEPRGALITVDAVLHPTGSHMTFGYRGDWDDAALQHPAWGVCRRVDDGGRSVVRLDLPPAGMRVLG